MQKHQHDEHAQGKVALVTGASRGIGAALCTTCTQLGMETIAASRSGTCPGIADAKGNHLLHTETLDVANEQSIVSVFNRIKTWYGRLDLLVNNAGIGTFGPLEEMSGEDFDRVMETNARGTFLCCREAVKIMAPRKSGCIINISSVVGFRGYPQQSLYSASKHAIMGITKSLAREMQQKGIRVSAILPGGVDTDFIAGARPDLDRESLLHPDDIAHALRYLVTLSPRAAVDQLYIRRRGSTPF